MLGILQTQLKSTHRATVAREKVSLMLMLFSADSQREGRRRGRIKKIFKRCSCWQSIHPGEIKQNEMHTHTHRHTDAHTYAQVSDHIPGL